MTTSNMKKASNVLGKRCADTEKNMKAKMRRAGCEEYKTVKVAIARPYDRNDDVLVLGLNGELFYFLRGTTVNMPEQLHEIMLNTGTV
jgi:hypothetical protein